MAARSTIALLCVIAAAIADAATAPAEESTTPTTESIVVLGTKEVARPTTGTSLPRFDVWAQQPKLRCLLPAISSWTVVKHVNAQTRLPPRSAVPVGPPQIILAQRPAESAGFSKYSVIYQATRSDPTDRASWHEMAVSFHSGFLASLRESGRFQTIEISSPTITTVGEMRRMHLAYRVEPKTGERVSGAVLGAPARRGVLFFNLTLEGQGPGAIEAAMRELRLAVTKGLATSTRSATPYVVAALLAIPFLALVGILIKRRRGFRRSPSRTDRTT